MMTPIMSAGHTCAPWEYCPGVSQVCAGWWPDVASPGFPNIHYDHYPGAGAWPRPQKLPPPTCHFDIWLWLTSAEKCANLTFFTSAPWTLESKMENSREKFGKRNASNSSSDGHLLSFWIILFVIVILQSWPVSWFLVPPEVSLISQTQPSR